MHYVYVAETVNTSPLNDNYMSKIGKTKNLVKRAGQLKLYARDLKMVAVYKCPCAGHAHDLEKEIINDFIHSLVRGREFFSAPPADIIDQIEQPYLKRSFRHVRIM